MPLNEFTDEAFAGLKKGLEQIPVGLSKEFFDAFEIDRNDAFHRMIRSMTT